MTAEEIVNYIDLLGVRELDVLVARKIYNLEVVVHKVDYSPSRRGEVRYAVKIDDSMPKRRSRSNYAKSTYQTAQTLKFLPRYSKDVKDSLKLLEDVVPTYGIARIDYAGRKTASVTLGQIKSVGEMPKSIAKVVLINYFLKYQDSIEENTVNKEESTSDENGA